MADKEPAIRPQRFSKTLPKFELLLLVEVNYDITAKYHIELRTYRPGLDEIEMIDPHELAELLLYIVSFFAIFARYGEILFK